MLVKCFVRIFGTPYRGGRDLSLSCNILMMHDDEPPRMVWHVKLVVVELNVAVDGEGY